MITYTPITRFGRGDLFDLIYESYREFIEKYPPKNKEKYIDGWKKFDKNAFDNPKVGDCIFVTCLDGKPIGVASYDPRNFPKFGVIGQNCILPEFRGRGYGKMQVKELLRIFKQNGCKKAKVTTGDHLFFLPAQKMYLTCGFYETQKYKDENIVDFPVIEFEKVL